MKLTLFLLLATRGFLTLRTFCSSQNNICISGWTDNGTSCFQISTKNDGWAAVAFGTVMAGSDMYAGWRNSSNGYTVANLEGQGHVQPRPYSVQNIQFLSELAQNVTTLSGMNFVFCLKNSAKVTSSSNYIFAYSASAPSSPNSISSTFNFHDDYGSFRADFTTSSKIANSIIVGSSSDDPIINTTNYVAVVTAHAALMWIAWILFSVTGIFTARFLKTMLPTLWFPVHRGLMVFGTGIFTAAGLIVIFLYKKPPHFSNSHENLGLAVIIFMVAEILLGWVIDKMYDAGRKTPPTRDQIHWWFGRLILLLSIINVQLGFSLFQEKFPGILANGLVVGNWIFISLAACGFLAAQFGGFIPKGAHVPVPGS